MNKVYAVELRQALFGDHQGALKIANEKPGFYISMLLPNIFVFAAIILLAYLVFGGFLMVVSASVEETQKGQQAITNAIIGFIVIFTSYWIVQIIQVITGAPVLGN